MICKDVPEGPKKVSKNDDEDNKTTNFKRVHDVDLVHNFVVVLVQWLDFRVQLNLFGLQTCVKFLN